MRRTLIALTSFALLVGCKRSERPEPQSPLVEPAPETRAPAPDGPDLLLLGATVMTATGEVLRPGAVLVVDGRIETVEAVDDVAAHRAAFEREHEGVPIVELKPEQVVTPGIIDTHSHMGVYASPGLGAHADGNEMTAPATPHVRAEDGVWPQDPQFGHALAGGVTTAQILPGSANLIGGRSFTLKLRPGARSAEDMRFAGAPAGLKMACGENPKRVYGEKGGPATRMGNVAGYRAAFQGASEYRRQWADYERDLAQWERGEAAKAEAPAPSRGDRRGQRTGDAKRDGAEVAKPPTPPARDFGKETLVGVLEGKVLVHMHCYRADEMSLMLELADSFGFSIRSFHHAVEAYKIADRLARAQTAASVWADWWGFKLEAYDGVRENAALITKAGARAIIHSDSGEGIQRLNQEAAKAMFAGRRAGIDISEDQALRWLTINPAWALGVDDQVGTIEPGKMADLVVWSGSPFSVYTRAERVYIEGEPVFDRHDPKGRPQSDFDLGLRDDLRGAP